MIGIEVSQNDHNEDFVVLKINREVLAGIRSALIVSEDDAVDYFDRDWAAAYTEINEKLPIGKNTTASNILCILRGCHPERFA